MKKELAKKIKELVQYLNSGISALANEIIDLYNEVFGPNPKTGRKVGYTSCGSCLIHRLIELINAKNMYMASLRAKKNDKKEKDAASSEKDCN